MSINCDARRLLIEAEKSFASSIECSLATDGGLNIEIRNDWAGDSETGFGRDTSVELSPQEFEALSLWILAARNPRKEHPG